MLEGIDTEYLSPRTTEKSFFERRTKELKEITDNQRLGDTFNYPLASYLLYYHCFKQLLETSRSEKKH